MARDIQRLHNADSFEFAIDVKTKKIPCALLCAAAKLDYGLCHYFDPRAWETGLLREPVRLKLTREQFIKLVEKINRLADEGFYDDK